MSQSAAAGRPVQRCRVSLHKRRMGNCSLLNFQAGEADGVHLLLYLAITVDGSISLGRRSRLDDLGRARAH